MTHESLENFIHEANSSDPGVVFSKYAISKSVDLALAWVDEPNGRVANEEGYRIYLIKSDQNYVAAVFEMGTYNLHWFVLPAYRKKGILSHALHSDILPHMFTDGREYQRASFESEENEAYLMRQGFEPSPKTKDGLILERQKVKEYDLNQVKRTHLSADEVKEVKQEMRLLAARIRMVADRLYCAYGDDRYLYEQANEIVSESCDVGYFETKKGMA